MKSTVLLVALVVGLQSCASTGSSHVANNSVAAAGDSWIEDELYFGALIPTGGEVSDSVWEDFVDREASLRFPAGLTTIRGTGRYQYKTGEIKREPGWIMVILYPATDTAAPRKINEIMDVYKKRFAQESVLRTRKPVTIEFR